jgi:predicted DNA-binding transcriptional regulator AlpA
MNGVMSATQETPPFPTLWDVKACAKFLGRSPRWVYRALSVPPSLPGSIPHFRLGASPRFIPDDISAWLAQGCPPAASFLAWKKAEGKKAECAEMPLPSPVSGA